MKIKIHNQSSHFTIPVPNSVAFNFITAKIASHQANKAAGKAVLTTQQMRKLFSCIKSVKNDFRELEFVNVESKDGECIKVYL